MLKIRDRNGFTLIEIILVIAVLGILASIALPRLGGVSERAKLAIDKVALRTINHATSLYNIHKQKSDSDIFEGFSTNEERMKELVNQNFIDYIPEPESKGAEFRWLKEKQFWTLFIQDTKIPLSPLGSDFEEISMNMIGLIQQREIEQGSYGRTWGDFQYTDIGLDPEDWGSPVGHIYYKPVGQKLLVRPEAGYNLVVEDQSGNLIELTNEINYNLVYNDQDGKWYYHSISEENVINIDTLEIKR